MAHQPTTLEITAIETAIRASVSPPLRDKLLLQIPLLQVLDRKYTGFGFYTKFNCNNCCAVTGMPTGPLDKFPIAWASHPEVVNGEYGGICFNVFIESGIIDVVEAASVTTWPSSENEINFLK